MKGTRCKPRGAALRDNETFGDLEVWKRANGEDNSEQLARLRKNLRLARRAELTPRQAQLLHLRYDLGMTVSQIAEAQGVQKSTVSRTLRRGRERLKKCLKYSF